MEQKNHLQVLSTTCFNAHNNHKVCCNKKSCRQWINFPKQMNCTLVAAHNGPLTLEMIGELLGGLSRMRICQVVTMIKNKIRTMIS
jgi:hypothetical protein